MKSTKSHRKKNKKICIILSLYAILGKLWSSSNRIFKNTVFPKCLSHPFLSHKWAAWPFFKSIRIPSFLGLKRGSIFFPTRQEATTKTSLSCPYFNSEFPLAVQGISGCNTRGPGVISLRKMQSGIYSQKSALVSSMPGKSLHFGDVLSTLRDEKKKSRERDRTLLTAE